MVWDGNAIEESRWVGIFIILNCCESNNCDEEWLCIQEHFGEGVVFGNRSKTHKTYEGLKYIFSYLINILCYLEYRNVHFIIIDIY